MGTWLKLMLRLLRGQFGRCEAEKKLSPYPSGMGARTYIGVCLMGGQVGLLSVSGVFDQSDCGSNGIGLEGDNAWE